MSTGSRELGNDINKLDSSALQLFTSSGCSDWPRKNVLIGAVDTGDGTLLSAIGIELNQRGWGVQALVKGKAADVFSADSRFKLQSGDPLELITKDPPRTVFTGMSSEPEFGAALNTWGFEHGARRFAAGDYPGAYVDNMKVPFQADPRAVPEAVFVLDKRAGEVERERFNLLSLPVNMEIIPCGNPILDLIARSNRQQIQEESRQKLGIPNNVLAVTWFGQIGEPSVESLRVVLAGLHESEMGDWMLAVRFHPRDNNANNGIYQQMLNSFSRKLIWATRDVEPNVDKVIVASDLIFQEKSTVALQAAAWGVIAASVVVPEIERGKSEEMAGLWVPMIENRTSPVVSNRDDMRTFLNNLRDPHYVDMLNRRMAYFYRQDGKAAERIADEIEKRMTA